MTQVTGDKNMRMKMMLAVLAAVAIASVGAFAHGLGWMHDDVEQALDGTYADLQELREQTGMPMMPWVDSEESFARMREHHEAMEQYHADGYGPMGYGRGMGGCHAWN